MELLVLLLLLVSAIGLLVLVFTQWRKAVARSAALQARFRDIVDVDAEKARIVGEIIAERTRLEAEMAQIRAAQAQNSQTVQAQWAATQAEARTLQQQLEALRSEVAALDEEANLQSFGLYRPHYDFASSQQYQAELEKIRERQKQMVKDKTAAVCPLEWQVNGSRAEGRKQINQTLKLMLRAFNGEGDAAIAKVKYNNVRVMETRIRKARETINSLTTVTQSEITSGYLDLKLRELYLAHEYQEKLQREKEEQQRIREQIREDEIAQRELEKAKVDAEREERRYADALVKAREEANQAVGDRQQRLLEQINDLQRRLDEAHTNKERALARAQMTRSGHVYVISNIGSFGEHVYKIGMTRRLDPVDRIRELGDASVPFQFDIHAIIYADDAPALEAALHRKFGDRRINKVNERKEFFRVTIDEIAKVVRQHDGRIEVTLMAEAPEYRKTLAMIQEGVDSRVPVAA